MGRHHGGHGGICSRRGGLSSGMHPPLSSSQSPLSSVSACGENCACSLAPQGHFRAHSVGLGAPPLPTARGAAVAPHRDIKKTALASACRRPTARRAALRPETNAPRPVEKKNVRRVGQRRRRPPAAGGGWLALPCRSQGRKRPALGEAFGPGKSGIHPASLFAAAGLVVDVASATGR